MKPFDKTRITCALWILLLNPSTLLAQPYPDPPKPWREQYNIQLGNFVFVHPMTVIDRVDITRVLANIQGNTEPQRSAFQALIAEAENQLDFSPDAPDSMDIMGGYEPNSNLSQMRDWLWRNSHAAYTSALAYIYSGDSLYASKAREVIMDWANTYTTFTGGDRGLQLGSWFSPLLYAADLIWDYQGFTGTDKEQLREWLQDKWLDEGDLLNVMRRRDNNWKDAGLLGCMCASVILEDTLILKECLVQLMSYFYPRVDEHVDLPGTQWKIRKDQYGVYLPREVVRNEGSSGLTYTAYALTTMTQCFEIARYAGFDLWHETTQEEAGIQELIEQYFKWDIENAPFPWHTAPNKTSKRRNCYELANNHFNLPDHLTEWIYMNRPLRGREGDEYITLNKGAFIDTALLEVPLFLSDPGLILHQNAPNPFNQVTEISFAIARRGKISLIVYDPLGRQVAKLVDKELGPGTYRYIFDATGLSDGVYMFRLNSGRHSMTRKMLYLR